MRIPQSNDPRSWYQLVVEYFLVSGKSLGTAQVYSREVRIMAQWLGEKRLDLADDDDLKDFLLYRRNDCNLTGSSMRIVCCGLRGLFQGVLQRDWPLLTTMNAPHEEKLPLVLSREEVWRIISHADQLHHRVYLQTVYSCGLRLSEGLNLTVHDIDKHQMQVYVRAGKGKRDRAIPLPKATYKLLRYYWATHRNPLLIFPGLGRSHKDAPTAQRHMTMPTAQEGLRRAVRAAGIRKPGVRIHTLRHCYATHLLEAGVNVHAIQRYLGHKSLDTTLIYFHLTSVGQRTTKAVIERLMSSS